MYDADPFAAQKMVEERQAKAAQRKEEPSKMNRADDPRLTNRSSTNYPEVIMAGDLRDLVENAVKKVLGISSLELFSRLTSGTKKGFELYPEEAENTPLTLAPDVIPEISLQLGHLGFTKAQIKDATKFLSQESPLTFKLLDSLSPLEAAIEYLILHVPECDLPEQFLPSVNASNPFITSAHSGQDDLVRRWVEDKAVKEAGWPPQAVKECIAAEADSLKRWDLLMVALGRKLIGEQTLIATDIGKATPYVIEEDENEALGAYLEEEGHLVLPLFSAPIKIHILFSATEQYPRPSYIPIYITSNTTAAYVRLHLLSRFLTTMQANPELEAGQGFVMTVMQIIEAEWATVEDHGPPDISTVMKYLIPSRDEDRADDPASRSAPSKIKRIIRQRRNPQQDDNHIRREFESLVQTEKVDFSLEITVFDSFQISSTKRCCKRE